MKSSNLLIKLAVFLTLLLTIFVIFSVESFGQKVRYNYLQGTDFSKYKTYRWVKLENVQYPAQLVDEQIVRAIDSELSTRGLRRVETGDSDLLVVYQAAINQERQWNAYSTGDGGWGYGGWGRWGGYGGYGGGMSTTTATSSTINIGTLHLDFYDVGLKKQVWRGEAIKTLDPPKDPNKLQKRINKGIAKLLKNYPPRADD
jgi:hypothetical protein